MLRFRLAAVLVVLIALLFAGHLWMRDGSPSHVAGAPTASGQSDGTSGTSGSKSGKKDKFAKGQNPQKDSGSKNPGGNELAPVTVASEAPGATKGSGLPGLKAPTKGPLIKAPLPKQASRKGGLVAGYPAAVLPAVPASKIGSTSVSPSGKALQVALDGTTAHSLNDVLRFYRIQLAKSGFRDSVAPAVGGSSAVSFTRPGRDTLVLTVTPTGKTSSHYTLFGTLHAGTG